VDAEIKTLDSLINVGRKTTGGWRLVDDIDWASIPIGLCPGEYLLQLFFIALRLTDLKISP
jgi:hypothetical protein